MRTDADCETEFQSASNAHLPKLLDWLEQPHARRCWGDVEGEAAGYAQAWKPSDFDEEDWLKRQPVGAIGVDIFAGEPETTGRGLGPEIVRAFCIELPGEDAKGIVMDPDLADHHAVSAYRQASSCRLANIDLTVGRRC